MVRKASAMGYTGAPTKPHSAIGWLRRSLRGPIGVVADLTARLNLSVRAKILLSLCIVILIMSITNVMLVVQVLNYSRQYDAIIANITTANSISGHIKPDIDTEMWRIVAGKIEFTDGKQYDIINDVNTKLRQMMDNTDSPRARIKLEGILRTMLTLTYEVNRMGQQIARGSTTAENEAVLENIRFVSGVVEEVVQDYALFEVQRTSTQYQQMREGFTRWEVLYFVLMFGAVGFSVLAAWGISRSIYIPIKKLHDVTTTITKNDLQALVTHDNVDEITELGMSFNIMIGKNPGTAGCQGQGTGESEKGRAASAAGSDQPALSLQHAGHDHLDDGIQKDRPGDRDRQGAVEFLQDQPQQRAGLDHDWGRSRADQELSDHPEDALSRHPGLPDRGG